MMKSRLFIILVSCALVWAACDRKVSKSYDSSYSGVSLVDSTFPINGATGVTGVEEVRIYFSANTDLASISSGDFSITGDRPYSIRRFGRVVLIDFFIGLDYRTNYTITVGPYISDLSGKQMSRAYSFLFRTGIGPEITSHYPLVGDTGVPIDTIIEISFSRDMDSSTITEEIFVVGDNIPGNVFYKNKTAYFEPEGRLEHDHLYQVTFFQWAKDLAGNRLADNYSWNFRTIRYNDTVSPFIIYFAPGAGATEVALNSKVTVAFSEPPDPVTVNFSTFYLNDSVPGTFSFNDNSAIFTPERTFDNNKNYNVTITDGITDTAGLPIKSGMSWSFTTEEVLLPVLMPLAVGNEWVYEYSYFDNQGLTNRYDVTIRIVSEVQINSEIWYVDQQENRYINRPDGLYGVNNSQNGLPRLISYIPNRPYDTTEIVHVSVPAGEFDALHFETYEVYYYDYGTVHRWVVPNLGLVNYECYFHFPFEGDKATFQLLSFELVEN